ncbi:MAG: M48 family metallopeptidase [Bacteroidia bacterium]
MKKIYLILIFAFFYTSVLSQNNYKHGFLNYVADTLTKNSTPSYRLYRQQIHKKYDTLFNNKTESNKFAKYLVADLRNQFENGNIYTNWSVAQDYLNKVFKKIIPNANADSVNIKIIRSTDVNAFMTATGQAYITVGFLANALNEAEIAATLGHEYGHHIHLDAYKRFNEYLINEKHKKVGNMLAGYGGGIYRLIATSNMYNDFKDMERDADQTSIELTQNAGYNLLARVNVQKRYKAIEENNQKDKDYKPTGGLHFKDYRYGFGFGFYFRDHPPTQERIDVAQKAANKSDTANTKYFQVDEDAFQKMKLQAVDECINLYLEQQQFEDCIELCYKQLLFYPNDEFYLFYINESLRRFLLVNPKEADNFFITARYNTYTKYIPKNKLPVYVNSTKVKVGDFNISQSIFYHYEYLELADKNKLLVQLPVNELTKTDTLEFISNKDALNYFISKQEKLKQSSVSWVKNCVANTLEDVDINSYEIFLNRYNDIKKDVLNMTSKAESNTAIPCVLVEVNYSGRASFISRSDFNTDSLPKQSRRFMQSRLETPYAYFNLNKLTPAEKNTMLNVIYGMAGTVRDFSKVSEKIEKANLPLKLLAPETAAIINKYKLQQLMVVGIQVTDAISVAQIGMPLSYSITFSMYYIDFKNGFLSHTLETHGVGSTSGLESQIQNLNQYLPTLRH